MGRGLLALLLLLVSLHVALAGPYELQGQHKGNTKTWAPGKLQNWLELDYIPCRVFIAAGPLANQTFTVSFPHLTGSTPGFENLYSFMASSNVVFLSAPTLASPTNADWFYSFTVQVTNTTAATIQFQARLAAGAHLNVGSSLQLSGLPSSMGNLQVFKPAAGPGAPDLAIRKTGPASAQQGGSITYTLAYTNQVTNPTNGAVGVQASDILAPEITVLTNSLGTNAHFSGNTIFWDLTNVAAQAAGQFSFQAQVGYTVPVGRVITNFSQILSSENDANYLDNTSLWLTTVTEGCLNPPLYCASNKSVQCGAAWSFDIPIAGDATDSNAIVVLNTVTNAACGNTFSATRTWRATDFCGHTGQCSQIVTVVDTPPPVLTCSANKTVEPGAAWTFDPPTATDACGTNTITVVGTTTNRFGGCPDAFTATRTWRASDACGNRSECSQTVTVAERTPPQITCPADLTVNAADGSCASNVTFTVTATDNCSVTNLVSRPPSGSAFPIGTTIVTNSATDASGNQSSCRFTVTVTDHQSPVITCASNLVLTADPGQCSRSNVTFLVSATDNCSVTNLVSRPPSGSTFPVGATTVTNTATDACGNSSQCTFTVTVLDQQPPSITCPPDLTTNTAPGANAVTNIALGTPVTVDNCAVAGFSNNAPAMLPVGTNFVLWTVTDGSGNRASCPQRVVVVRSCSGSLTVTPLTNQVICPNQPVLFETTASSPEPITYVWKFNGHPIPGQTTNSLKLQNVDRSGGGVYSVEARTECAVVAYDAALAVLEAPEASPIAYTNASPIAIDESGEATPYYTVITPQCVPGVVKKLTVTIYGFSHRSPRDLSLVVVSPDGHQVKLMAGAGGGPEHPLAAVDLTFSDAAADQLPQADPIVSGTYLPTDYLPEVFLPPPAAGPYSNNLATFIGVNPNGPWKLCVFDGVDLDGGTILSWSLDLEWREKTLCLQNPVVLPSGEFQAEVVGQTGIPTIIERSSDLVTWLPVATNVFHGSPGVFTDPAPLYPYRYYRALQP